MDESQRLDALNVALATLEPGAEGIAMHQAMGGAPPSSIGDRCEQLSQCESMVWDAPLEEVRAHFKRHCEMIDGVLLQRKLRLERLIDLSPMWSKFERRINNQGALDALKALFLASSSVQRLGAMSNLDVMRKKDGENLGVVLHLMKRDFPTLWSLNPDRLTKLSKESSSGWQHSLGAATKKIRWYHLWIGIMAIKMIIKALEK